MTTNNPQADPVDIETLAAYIDGRLTGEARAALEARLAADEDAYELLVEVMRTSDALQVPSTTASPKRTNWLMWAGGSVAAAAALVLAVRFMPVNGGVTTPLSPLVSAVNGERYVEPRVSGGFPSGPVRSSTRGQDLSAQNLSLLAAVGEAQRQAQSQPTARNLHVWGVGLLLLGDLDQAIDTLESALVNEPDNATILSDLAAAYAVRAAGAGSARDWSNALDRSERAIRTSPESLEPYFNRALALEALGLDGAREAWQAYLDRDSTSDWAREAREHLTRLAGKPQGSRRPANEEAIRAALDGTGALDAAVNQDPQRAREWLEEDLAREWAAAVIARDAAGETRARQRGERLLSAYDAVARDALPGQALRHLWSGVVTNRDAVAAAVVLFTDAATAVREDRLSDATALLTRALPTLESSHSPLALWARYYLALDQSQQGRFHESFAILDHLNAAAEAAGFSVLAGTVRNRRGTILGRQGNQEGANRERLAAIVQFDRARDSDQIAVMHSMLSEAYRYLGDTQTAWRHHGEALKTLDLAPNHRSRHLILVQAGLTATFEGHLDAANAFQRQVVDNGRQWRRASGTSTGLMQIARNSFRLGRIEEAEAAIREARAMVPEISEASFRNRLDLEVLGFEAEIFGTRSPAIGLPMLTAAVDRYSQRGLAVRLSNLLLARGRLHLKAGDAQAAEADWQRAVDALESERSTVSVESLRLAQAGSLRALQGEIAFARVARASSGSESLMPIERGRARTLVEDALETTVPAPDLNALQEQLDDSTGILHYAIGDADAVAWLTTHREIIAARLPVNPQGLAVLVDRYRRLSARAGATIATNDAAGDLYRALIAPLGSAVSRLSSLIVIPDPALAGVSFGALTNPETGSYLIEAMSVAVAPSATLLSSPASASPKSGVLLIGADRPPDMPALPWVANELSRLTSVYANATVLTGDDATRERLLSAAPRSALIHFAGHAFGSPANPLLSRLILHPGADGRSDLYAYELSTVDVSSSIVVLAACRTGFAGAGAADDDGVLAMARPFLARGARAVLATYRDVSDSGAPALMEQFHRQLSRGQAPADAWRATAITALGAPNGSSDWTAYAVFLGRGSLDATRARPLTDVESSGGR